MTDDLQVYSRIVRTVAEERRARIAGSLSVAAIVLLLITSVTVAHRGVPNAAPQAVSLPSSLPHQPAVAAPYTPCPKLNRGAWLRWEIAHWRKDGYVIQCSYWGQELMTRDEVNL